MSMPGWHASHARRSQNGEVIGPLTGQMKRPPPLIGPAGIPPKPGPERRSVASIFACCACSDLDVLVELVRVLADGAEQRALAGRGRVCDRVALALHGEAHARDRVAALR